MKVEIGIRTGEGCDHPEDQRTNAVLNPPPENMFCKKCGCVLVLEDGVYVAQPTGIRSARFTGR